MTFQDLIDSGADDLLFAADGFAISVTHYPPSGDSEELEGLFAEFDNDDTDQHDAADGLKRVRTAKLVLPSSVTVTLGKVPSNFSINAATWQATAVISGRGVQTVRLTRREQATQARLSAQPRQ
ncbi:MAG: hypothetical protein A3E01_10800 [Gammaproteobacteria bacterium RIFCSPHIGHO2_12_FULL_63_22]|nr:MAG: hypothetical protein A3E01_10800 [Gammaproteobacteria bacterium RIFCSPHIGHO2_12_FULL_63_22]